MKSILFTLTGLLICLTTLAQEIKIAPVFGPNISFAGYSKATRTVLKNDLPDWFEQVGAKGKVTILPAIRIQIGGLVDYALSEALSLQTGLLFDLRGYSIKIKASGNSSTIKATGKTRMSYLELPLWGKYRLGETGFSVSIGPTFGLALSGKTHEKATVDGESESETQKLFIGTKEGLDNLKPMDVSLNLGIIKQISVADQPLEVSFNMQPSLTKWTVTGSSEHYGRYITASVRVAYFFKVK